MDMVAWTLLGVALVAASPFMVLQIRRRRDLARATSRAPQVSRQETRRPSNPFAAVSICPSADLPCAAVLKIQDQRFLAMRAPRLPIAGCDRERCTCRYVRHKDRRRPGDRRDNFARFGGLLPNAGRDQRGPRDRRKLR